MIRLRGGWVFPGDGPPLRNAVLTLDEGRVESVTIDDLRPAQDLSQFAILPGLVNAHTHLEFSHLPTPIEPRREFAGWIRSVIASRRNVSTETTNAIERGLHESLRSGATALAEIATTDWILESLPSASAPCCFVFREILGLREQGISEQLETARRFLSASRSHGLRDVGLSPHAPYSIHPQLFQQLCELAVAYEVPLAMHLAESPAEIQLLRTGDGPLVELFTQMGLWQTGIIPRGSRPLAYLQALAQAPRALVIHGTCLDEEEIDFLARSPHMSVIYCPRTHAAMQQGTHPWRKFLQRGLRVAIGTDSRASNPDLSLWNELKFLQTLAPDMAASRLLSLATSNAADALGWSDRGRIAPATAADLCLVRLTDNGLQNPEQFLFDGEVEDVWLNGKSQAQYSQS